MFHRHDPASRTMQAEGVILERRPSALYRTRIRLVIGVKFDDGQTVEFTEELVDFCTPPANTFSERLHALIGKDVVPLSFTVGERIPVRFDPNDRTKLSVDEPTLHDEATRKHMQAVIARRAEAEATLADDRQGPSLPSEDTE